MIRRATLVLAGVGSWASCAPERNRPGPPSVVIEVRSPPTVLSPDTLPFAVLADDPGGLDSLDVTFLDSTTAVETGFRRSLRVEFRWPVPAALPTAARLTIRARALDLEGQAGVDSAMVEVVTRR